MAQTPSSLLRFAALLLGLSCQSLLGLDDYEFEDPVQELALGPQSTAGKSSEGVDAGAAGGAGGGSSSRVESAAGGPSFGGAHPGGATNTGTMSAVDAGSAADAAPTVPCEGSGIEVCDGIDNDCDGRTEPPSTCPDLCTGFALEDHGYMFCRAPADQDVAVGQCKAQGMRLAWIQTQEENAGLLSKLSELAGPQEVELFVRIGATDAIIEGQWFWTADAAGTESLFWQGNPSRETTFGPFADAYSNWSGGEPNDTGSGEDCGLFSVNGSGARLPGTWNDGYCSDLLMFVCEQ